VTAPKPQPHPYVVTDEDGAALGINWERIVKEGQP
jgi:hypothetical protein